MGFYFYFIVAVVVILFTDPPTPHPPILFFSAGLQNSSRNDHGPAASGSSQCCRASQTKTHPGSTCALLWSFEFALCPLESPVQPIIFHSVSYIYTNDYITLPVAINQM